MLTRLVTRRPRAVLLAAAALFVICAGIAATTIESLSLNRYEAPGSESVDAREVLGDRFGTSSPNVALLVSPEDGDVDDTDVTALGRDLTRALGEQPGIGDAWSYWSPDAPDTLASEDGRHALVLAWAPGDADRVRGEVLPQIEDDVVERLATEGVTVRVGGGDEIFRIVADQARADFLRAELIILPLVLLLLWAVYRRFVPALATLGIGLLAVVGSLTLIRLVVTFVEVSTFAANVSLVMGIGLGVDYSLFMIYRFREQIAAGSDVEDAVRRTMATAGRTVLFSGLTVAGALAVLLLFPFPFLSSFAYAGIAVVLAATGGAGIVLPALLMTHGRRMLRAAPGRATGSVWTSVTQRVMRRPLAFGGAGLVLLLLLGAPTAAIDFGSPDDRVLNADHSVRTMYDVIRADFAAEDADALYVVAREAPTDAALATYAAELSALDGVARVDAATGAYVDGVRTGAAGPYDADRFHNGEATWLAVLPTGERLAEDPVGLVNAVRDAAAPTDVAVGGYPAELADYRAGVVDRLPLVAALILLVTFAVLFLMTGSVVAPLVATVLNLLSLGVMFGVVVAGFQKGLLSGPLGFTATGVIEPSILLLMFCIAYGLSMDYQVFLLSRIKEEYDRSGSVQASVTTGIARSAPLITAAAIILATSFAVYATSEVSFLQQLGIGMAVAVLVDATVVRGVLVPACIALIGRSFWWAPRPLQALHRRIGWTESSTEERVEVAVTRVG